MKTHQAGFGLIETLIAVFILALSIMGLLEMVHQSQRLMHESAHMQQQQLQQLEKYEQS